ncbi:MAG: hypothetical protein ACFFC7_20945 [Candidatus Hermodarchaeota archaeon]
MVRKKRSRAALKRKRQLRRKKDGSPPILGVHSYFDFKIMKEVKPPVDKKTQRKLKHVQYSKRT